MKTLCVAIIGLVFALATPAMAEYDPAKVQGGGCYAELYQARTIVGGGYEYVIDFYSNGGGSQDYAFWGFDNAQVVNTYNAYGKDLPRHFWSFQAAYGNDFTQPPSYGGLYCYSPDGGDAVFGGDDVWTESAHAWSMLNPWHAPSEYGGLGWGWSGPVGPEGEFYEEAGGAYWVPSWIWSEKNKLTDTFDASETYNSVQGGPGTCSEDMMYVENISAVWGHGEGLMWTMRIVTPQDLSAGDLTWSMPSYGVDPDGDHLSGGLYEVLWIEDDPSEPGDFDDDGDIDADDVDMLCANMGGDVSTYDLDGDGDVDEDDMTFHVTTYLEYDSDGDGIADGAGTFRGDFNTDGVVNGTDLSIMSGGFGTTTGFAGGNANCDATVNGTDLSILSSVFGNVATAAVPEPVTMALLSLGGVALLRRRSR
jgi:hypothetical protein